jgi:RNA polymerase sigma-70 factor (ECF subfamily)
MRLSDSEILEKLKKEDYSGYRILFDQYYKPLCVYSLKYCDSFSQAEDIVQDLFVKFWNDKLYLKLNESIGPYLFKSVKNNTLLFVKNNAKYQFEDIESQINKLMEEEAIDLQNIEKEKVKLYQEIDALPEKCKEVFKAIVIENLKYKEAAAKLGVSVNTIKTHYSRALKQLRHSLDMIIILLLV